MNLFRKWKESFFSSHLSPLERQILERISYADDQELKTIFQDSEKMLQRGTISEKAYTKIKAEIQTRLY